MYSNSSRHYDDTHDVCAILFEACTDHHMLTKGYYSVKLSSNSVIRDIPAVHLDICIGAIPELWMWNIGPQTKSLRTKTLMHIIMAPTWQKEGQKK